MLNKKTKLRQPEDINKIAEQVYDIKFFKNIVSDNAQRLEFVKGCAKYIKYKFYSRGTEIFRHGYLFIISRNLIELGDKGKDFYLVIRGEVVEFFKKDEQEIRKDSQDTDKKLAYDNYAQLLHSSNLRIKNLTPLTRKNLIKTVLSNSETVAEDLSYEEKLLFLNDSQPEELAYFVDRIAAFKQVMTYRNGDHFGEWASIFDGSRTSSVIAKDDTYVFSFKSKHYTKLFASEVENVLTKVQYFQKMFLDVPEQDIAKFCYLIEEKSYKFNETICKEGESTKGMYFIREGSVQVTYSFLAIKLILCFSSLV